MIFRSALLQTICWLLFFLNLGSSLSAQSPYDLSAGKDLAILGISGGILTTSIMIGKKCKPIEYEEWKNLNREDVFAFDRSVTREWSGKARKLSDILLYSSAALPFSLAISRKSHSQLAAVGLFTLEATALNLGLTNLTKNIVLRPRPFTYNHEGVPWDIVKKQDLKDARRSFFSGHTSTTASMYFMTAQMYSDFHPNSKFKSVAWIGAATIPAFTGLMRVKAGKHYYTDIITGYVVGAVIGILIPKLHQ